MQQDAALGAKLGRLCLSGTKGREPNRLYTGDPLLEIAVRDGENKREVDEFTPRASAPRI